MRVVICISPMGSPTEFALEANKEYIETEPGIIKTGGVTRWRVSADRFEEAPKKATGYIDVHCKKVDGNENVTPGRNYVSSYVTQDFICVSNDDMYDEWLPRKNFEVVGYPKTFTVTGEVHHLTAFSEDLKSLGWEIANSSKHPVAIATSLPKFNRLYWINGYKRIITFGAGPYEKRDNEFHLPLEYTSAYVFAQRQAIHMSLLNSNKKRIKVGEPEKEITVFSDGKIWMAEDQQVPYVTSVENVTQLLSCFKDNLNDRFPLQVNTHRLWIGCEDGCSIDKGDIEYIIRVYEEIQ